MLLFSVRCLKSLYGPVIKVKLLYVDICRNYTIQDLILSERSIISLFLSITCAPVIDIQDTSK